MYTLCNKEVGGGDEILDCWYHLPVGFVEVTNLPVPAVWVFLLTRYSDFVIRSSANPNNETPLTNYDIGGLYGYHH